MTLTNQFEIPTHLNATEPAEIKKGSRDQVRLMVMNRKNDTITHDQFYNLGCYLKKGDLLVLNNSRTIPAVLTGKLNRKKIEVRLSRRISINEWEVLLVDHHSKIGEKINFNNQLSAYVTEKSNNEPLVILTFDQSGTQLMNSIYQLGEPIRYEYIQEQWPLEAYQTVYGSVPGSVELASAGRAFSWQLIHQLQAQGVQVAFVQLHAGLSYYENDDWPQPEEHPEPYSIPEETATLINRTKRNGGRLIAVGTTVVRALESAAEDDGLIKAQGDVTRLYVTKNYQLKAVDGLLTGLHEPEASHLDMLTAFIDECLLRRGYKEALEQQYLWHEFGDMNLILPEDH